MNSQCKHILDHIEKEIRLLVLRKSKASGVELDTLDFCLNRWYLLLRTENDRITRQDAAREPDYELMDAQLAVNKKWSEMKGFKVIDQ